MLLRNGDDVLGRALLNQLGIQRPYIPSLTNVLCLTIGAYYYIYSSSRCKTLRGTALKPTFEVLEPRGMSSVEWVFERSWKTIIFSCPFFGPALFSNSVGPEVFAQRAQYPAHGSNLLFSQQSLECCFLTRAFSGNSSAVRPQALNRVLLKAQKGTKDSNGGEASANEGPATPKASRADASLALSRVPRNGS